MSDSKSTRGDEIGLGSLFDSQQNSPDSNRNSASSSQGIRESDLQQLAMSLKSSKVLADDDGATTRKSLRDDDQMSATSKKFVAKSVREDDTTTTHSDDFEIIDKDGTVISSSSSSAPKAAPEGPDYLATWPADKVQSLKLHLKAAPWHDLRYSLQTYSNGMTGEEIIQWLRESKFAKSDEEAHFIGEAMVRRGMFFQLNRRSKFRGFSSLKKQQYTLEDNWAEEQQSLASKLSRAVKSANVEAVVVPFRLEKGPHVVRVFVEERQRRPDPSLPFSSEFLKKETDGPSFSMDRSLVPVPSVDDESPDMCEWVLDWEHVVDEASTDADGWKYSLDFKDPLKFVKGDAANKNFNVRLREWVRPARKRIEKKSERAKETEDEPVEEKTEAELEEEKKRELLSRAAQVVARVARAGTLELHVVSGEDLLKVCDSFVVVEHANKFSEKSDVARKAQAHHWDFKVDVPIISDLEGVRITVYQSTAIGRPKCLGQADLRIDAGELERKGTLLLNPRMDETESDLASQADSLGHVNVEWTFAPTGETNAKASSTKRCVLSVAITDVTGLTREKKRIGPCGLPVGKETEKVKFYFIVKYLGEYCEMQIQSPLFKFGPVVELQWKFSALLLPSVPVLVEYWHSDCAVPVGFFNLAFDATNVELPLQIELRKFVPEGIPLGQQGAGNNLGTVNAKVHWMPDMDSLEELIAIGMDPALCRQQKNLLQAWS